MKILDSNTSRVRPSVLIHGITGGGKSTFAEAGGNPLVILTEIKAESVLRSVNPNAKGLVPESIDDLEKLFEILGSPERMAKFDRIVLDSFTELTLSIPRWIKAKQGQTGTLVKLERDEYGHLRDYALALVKAIQLTGLPSVIIVRSTSKRVGLSERIVPDGMGKSVEELPGKLLPTAEARFDPELGYVIDTTPADHSQRCGLPWLPQVFQGSCLDYLALVEAGPQATTGVTPQATKPPTPDPEWVDLLVRYAASIVAFPEKDRATLVQEWEQHFAKDPATAKVNLAQLLSETTRPAAPDPEAQPEAYKAEFGKMTTEMQAEALATAKAKEHTPEVSDFVDGVSPECASKDDVGALLDLCATHKVNLNALWAYGLHKEQVKPAKDGSKNWNSVTKKFATTILAQLNGPNRVAFCSWLPKTYSTK